MQEKYIDEFYKQAKSKDRYRSYCKACTDNQQRDSTLIWASNNKERIRNNALKRKFGITLEQYEELLTKQDNSCAICKKHRSKFKKQMAVDHAHGNSKWIPKGAIRGILCDHCNRMVIGRNTDADIYESAAAYLRQHTGLIVPDNKKVQKRKPKR